MMDKIYQLSFSAGWRMNWHKPQGTTHMKNKLAVSNISNTHTNVLLTQKFQELIL